MTPSPPGIRWPEPFVDNKYWTVSQHFAHAYEHAQAEAEAWRQAAGMLREATERLASEVEGILPIDADGPVADAYDNARATLLATAPPTKQQDINPAHIHGDKS